MGPCDLSAPRAHPRVSATRLTRRWSAVMSAAASLIGEPTGKMSGVRRWAPTRFLFRLRPLQPYLTGQGFGWQPRFPLRAGACASR